MPNEVLERPGAPRGGPRPPRWASRWLRRMGVRNEDRVYTVGFVVLVVAVGTAANIWPVEVPSALLFPVVVGAGIFLSGRSLVIVFALSLAFLFSWAPDSGLEPLPVRRWSSWRSSPSWC